VLANALLGLPPVVVGCALGTPIVIALVHRTTVRHWRSYGDTLLVDGASRRRTIWPLLNIGREGLLTAFLAAFGRAIAEVGAIIIVGGNIRGYTRTMTPAIALETRQGRSEPSARTRNNPDRSFDGRQRRQPISRARHERGLASDFATRRKEKFFAADLV
jgi:ABC-type sulfate transport system permease component